MLVGGLVAVAVHAAGYLDLNPTPTSTAQGARVAGDSGS
jgi:hypothetical protein